MEVLASHLPSLPNRWTVGGHQHQMVVAWRRCYFEIAGPWDDSVVVVVEAVARLQADHQHYRQQ